MGVRVRQKVKGKGNPWWVFISHNGKRTSRKVGDKKYAEGLNLNTIKLIRAPINGVLAYAVELELIESNPLRYLVLKYKKKKFEIDPLTESESHLLLEHAKIFVDGTYYPSILCALRRQQHKNHL